MSLKEALLFKTLLNQLSEKEKKKYIKQLFETNYSLVINALFKYFIDNKIDAIKINNELSSTIVTTKKKQELYLILNHWMSFQDR